MTQDKINVVETKKFRVTFIHAEAREYVVEAVDAEAANEIVDTIREEEADMGEVFDDTVIKPVTPYWYDTNEV
jgi:hypothetical protein